MAESPSDPALNPALRQTPLILVAQGRPLCPFHGVDGLISLGVLVSLSDQLWVSPFEKLVILTKPDLGPGGIHSRASLGTLSVPEQEGPSGGPGRIMALSNLGDALGPLGEAMSFSSHLKSDVWGLKPDRRSSPSVL